LWKHGMLKIMSGRQIFIIILVVLVGVGGIAVGYFAPRIGQNPSTSAAESQTFPTIPVFEDQPASAEPASDEDYLFMTKFENKDPSADLDGSGQVNTLDLAKYRQLKNEK